MANRTTDRSSSLQSRSLQSADDVAAGILQLLGQVDAMALEKLLYYSQAWSMAIDNKPLFAGEVQAWRDGPVVPAIYSHHAGLSSVGAWNRGSVAELRPRTASIIELVCHEYGHLTGPELSELTHTESPWIDARGGVPPKESTQSVISLDAMGRYYRSHGTLAGWDAVQIAVSGILPSNTAATACPPVETPVYGYGQRGLTCEQQETARSSRRHRR
jgi:uncharacterized phage-associated protein